MAKLKAHKVICIICNWSGKRKINLPRTCPKCKNENTVKWNS